MNALIPTSARAEHILQAVAETTRRKVVAREDWHGSEPGIFLGWHAGSFFVLTRMCNDTADWSLRHWAIISAPGVVKSFAMNPYAIGAEGEATAAFCRHRALLRTTRDTGIAGQTGLLRVGFLHVNQ